MSLPHAISESSEKCSDNEIESFFEHPYEPAINNLDSYINGMSFSVFNYKKVISNCLFY